MLLEINGDIEYFASDDIVAADSSPNSNNNAFMTKMKSIWFCQYPVSVVQEIITMSYSAYLD